MLNKHGLLGFITMEEGIKYMIINKEEVCKLLEKIIYRHELNDDEIQALQVIRAYLINDAPPLTYDEFNELFKCKVERLDYDTIKIVVLPKYELKMKIDREINGRLSAYSKELSINICPEIDEHIIQATYSYFLKHVRDLRSKL